MCGMQVCGKCATVNLIFGILFLIAGFGMWSGAPAWWNGWTLIGLFLALWGLSGFMGVHKH